jgi:tellurite methyltransferase
MNKAIKGWNKSYQHIKSPWGLKPDYALIRYASLIPKGRVLDLGVGDGRNGLFWARLGCKVEGVDISRVAVKRCVENAKSEKLQVAVAVKDIKDMSIRNGRYSLIIAAWVLNFFKKTEAKRIIKRIKGGVKKNGFIYLSMFSTVDQGYQRIRKNFKMVEPDTYFDSEKNRYINFITKDELLSQVDDFEMMYCVEGTELDIGHGKPHYHGIIVYLGKRV